jgi:DNA modification methylase
MVNRRTGFVVDGHARVEEALTRHEPTVPVLYVDLSPEEEALVLATLDPIGAMATRDDARLQELLSGLVVDDAGLLALLADLAPVAPRVGLTDPDDVPPLGDESGIKPGDLFALGDHRLMCGDSTTDLSRLMGGSKAQMVMADPPYNVRYTGGSTNDQERADSYADAWTETEYGAWLGRVLTAAAGATDEKAALHIWFGSSMMRPVLDAIDAGGWERRQQIIWNKLSPHYGALGAQYKLRYEPMWYCHKRGQSPRWFGPTNEPAVWDQDQPRVNDLHPTMKPVALYARSLTNHSAPRDIVLECFSGSGTTIIAAEQLGRRCYAMEIDPRYVAVAIKRWEDFTGRKSERLDG